MSTKSSLFVYPSRRLGISSTHEVRRISSRAARRPCISSRASVHFLRLDDIQHFVLMICNSYGIDDIQGFALICFPKYGIINSTINKNLSNNLIDTYAGLYAFGFIDGYASKNGAIIALVEPPQYEAEKDVVAWCEKHNRWFSQINVEPLLGEYDRSYFQELLDDWKI